MSSKNNLLRITLTAIMASLVCVMTFVVQIPTLTTEGYLNLGDCFVLLSAWLLGPAFGFFAGGVGSAFADLFAGYAAYACGTLVIKGLMAICFGFLFRLGKEKGRILSNVFWFIAAVVSEAVMVVGYYLYEAIFMGIGFGGALAGVVGNIFQGMAGIVGAYFLSRILEHTGLEKKYSSSLRKDK